MKPERPLTPREEIEVRVTALLMGELSAEEAAVLSAQIARDAQLTALHAQLKQAIELLREATAIPEPSALPSPAKLSTDRRERLLAHFKGIATMPSAPRPRRDWKWIVPLGLAASLIALIGGAVVLDSFSPRKSQSLIAIEDFGSRNDATTTATTNLVIGQIRQSTEGDGSQNRWASQPGAISGGAGRGNGDVFRLYSSEVLKSDRGINPSKPANAPSQLASLPNPRIVLPAAQVPAQVAPLAAPPAAAESVQLFAKGLDTDAVETRLSAVRQITPPAGAVGGMAGGGTAGEKRPASPTDSPTGERDITKSISDLSAAPAQPDSRTLNFEVELAKGNRAKMLADAPQPKELGEILAPETLSDATPAPELAPVAPPADPKPIRETLGRVMAENRGASAESAGKTDYLENGRARLDGVTVYSGKSAVTGATTALGDQVGDLVELQARFGDAEGTAKNTSSPADERTSNSLGLAFTPPDLSKLGTIERRAFWAEDGASKKLNTASEGTFWDKPDVQFRGEVKLEKAIDGLSESALPGASVADISGHFDRGLSDNVDKSFKTKQSAQTEDLLSQGIKPHLTEEKELPADPSMGEPKKLLQEADNFYASGRYDLSYKRYEQVLEKDPFNVDAQKGQEKVNVARENYALGSYNEARSRAISKFDQAWANPVPKLKARPEAPTPGLELQPEIQTSANAFSTFSLNVSDVAFKLAGASLEQGKMPDPSTVRSEEFINAFDYRDPEPVAAAPLAFASERARYPFAQNRDLLRLSVKTAAAGRQAGRALNVVLLVDNSGSMERADRVRILQEALRVLAAQLQPQDKLSIITFARTPRLWADGVAGNQAGEATARVAEVTPQGGTNLAAALDLGYATALRHYQVGNINRVVLLTDGAANLGDVDPAALKQKVEAHRKQGIALDCFGVGWEGFNDNLLEQLSRNGDGRYGFINTPEEAATAFAAQLAGALRVAASDVKVQVEFNPRRVTAYRQIGYAKHQLTKKQFRDNTVDAAEMGAAESGNALYVVEVNPAGEGDVATVRVRFKVPGTQSYREHDWAVPFTGVVPPLEQATPALRLAAAAGAFSEWLAGSPYAAEVTSDRLLGYLNGVPAIYGADPRPTRLEWMIRQAKSLSGR